MVDALFSWECVEIVDAIDVGQGHSDVFGELQKLAHTVRFQSKVSWRNHSEVVDGDSSFLEKVQEAVGKGCENTLLWLIC